MAKKLAREMFDPTVRVHGAGRWIRGADGTWRVEDFHISTFELLDDDLFADVIKEIRGIPAEWKALDDPNEEIAKIREGAPRER